MGCPGVRLWKSSPLQVGAVERLQRPVLGRTMGTRWCVLILIMLGRLRCGLLLLAKVHTRAIRSHSGRARLQTAASGFQQERYPGVYGAVRHSSMCC